MSALNSVHKLLVSRGEASRSRRRLLMEAGALSLAATGVGLTSAAAQNATPSASPVASPAAPEVPSDEASAEQLAIAKLQGNEYGQASGSQEHEGGRF
ncbi:MAG: hypothetical protein ACR2OU_11200 [Thermomicrobiales bacterium]